MDNAVTVNLQCMPAMLPVYYCMGGPIDRYQYRLCHPRRNDDDALLMLSHALPALHADRYHSATRDLQQRPVRLLYRSDHRADRTIGASICRSFSVFNEKLFERRRTTKSTSMAVVQSMVFHVRSYTVLVLGGRWSHGAHRALLCLGFSLLAPTDRQTDIEATYCDDLVAVWHCIMCIDGYFAPRNVITVFLCRNETRDHTGHLPTRAHTQRLAALVPETRTRLAADTSILKERDSICCSILLMHCFMQVRDWIYNHAHANVAVSVKWH